MVFSLGEKAARLNTVLTMGDLVTVALQARKPR